MESPRTAIAVYCHRDGRGVWRSTLWAVIGFIELPDLRPTVGV